MTKEEFVNKIKAKHTDFEIDFEKEDAIQIKEVTNSNRVKTIKIGNLELAGVEVRTLLELRSASFTFEIEGDNIKFSVIGYGHGVGMSQTGADSLAKQGYSYEDIINHFYTGVEIKSI
jgi:stage II sporulation protein D